MSSDRCDDLQHPQHLHPSSVIFEVLSNVRRYIVPAILGVFGAAQGAVWGMAVAGFVFALSLLFTAVRYLTLRYRIVDSDLVITEGMLFRRQRSVPIRRIQNVDLIQNPLHRVFGVAEVRVETAAGTEPEATLRVLTHSQIEELRSAIFGQQEPSEDSNGDSPDPASLTADVAAHDHSGIYTEPNSKLALSPRLAKPKQTTQSVYAIPLRDLILAGLASNRGMVLVGVLLGFYFQGDFERQVDIDALQEMLPEATSTGLIVTAAIVLALGLFLLLRLLGVSWYVLRFYDYQLTRTGNDLRISCGLFTKVSATIPRERVQVISVHRGFLMRWLKLAAIRIETAGGAGSENENAASTVSRRWFLPVIRESELGAVLEALRPRIAQDLPQLAKTSESDPQSSTSASHSALDWHGVSPLTERRLMRLTLIAVLLISIMGWLFWKPWGLLAGPAITPWLILLARKKSRSKKFARAEWGVAYQSGWLTQKMSLAFYDRIQALSVAQSPFDRRWKMASLVVDTAAAGPAEHAIDIPYLDEQFAFMQFEELQQKIAYHQPRWA